MRGVRLPFRLLGVPLRLDVSFLLILPLLGWLIASQIPAYVELLASAGVEVDGEVLAHGATPAVLGFAAAVSLFACVVAHELGHVVAARAFGQRAEEITLWFLGGVARFRDLPRGPGAEAIVAAAGPAVSLAAAFAAGLAAPLPSADWARFLLAYLAIANAGLAVFNLLPALPLDGGRVLRSLLALAVGRDAATRAAVAVSRLVAVAMGVFGFFGRNLLLVALAFFVHQAAVAEGRAALLRRVLGGRRVRDLMTTEPATVPPDMPLAAFARLRAFRAHTAYPVVDAAGTLVGVARPMDAGAVGGGVDGEADADVDARGDATVADVMRPAQTVGPDVPATDVLARLGEGVGRLVVVGDDGAVVGVLSKTDVVRALERGGDDAVGPRW